MSFEQVSEKTNIICENPTYFGVLFSFNGLIETEKNPETIYF